MANPSKTHAKHCFDPKCRALAEHFLQDEDKDEVTESDTRDLAQAIQDSVEDWFAEWQHERDK